MLYGLLMSPCMKCMHGNNIFSIDTFRTAARLKSDSSKQNLHLYQPASVWVHLSHMALCVDL